MDAYIKRLKDKNENIIYPQTLIDAVYDNNGVPLKRYLGLEDEDGNVTITQADWNITDENSPSYIKNKPNIPDELIADVDYLTPSTAASTYLTEETYKGTVTSVNNINPNNGNITIDIPTVTNDLTNELKSNYDAAYAYSQETHAPSDAEKNVQSDWNVTDENSDAFIKNKPTIPSIDGLATEGYVDNKVSDLVNSAPETLNTLKELATALGDDPNFATTIAGQLGNKADSATTIAGYGITDAKIENNTIILGENSIEISSGLPEVTADDNDKVLKVVDGTWSVGEGGGTISADDIATLEEVRQFLAIEIPDLTEEEF